MDCEGTKDPDKSVGYQEAGGLKVATLPSVNTHAKVRVEANVVDPIVKGMRSPSVKGL
jgi:hypothetical protein